MAADLDTRFRNWRARHAVAAALTTVLSLLNGVLDRGRDARADDRNARSSDAWYLATTEPAHWRLSRLGRIATRIATPSGIATAGEHGSIRFVPNEIWERMGARPVVVAGGTVTSSGRYGLVRVAYESAGHDGVIVRTDSTVWRVAVSDLG